MLTRQDTIVANLGPNQHESPLGIDKPVAFVADSTHVRFDVRVGPGLPQHDDISFESAGPRARIFFDPARVTVGIVTCGGLSPGLNTVIRSAFYEFFHHYGVRRVLGIRKGYRGLNPVIGEAPVLLTPEMVDDITYLGGSFLGSSRGSQDAGEIVDFMEKTGIDVLLCVGGDGTQKGAHRIAAEVRRRGIPIAVVGVPKTIDNDIPLVWMSFGYATAPETAGEVIRAAHVEARGAHAGMSGKTYVMIGSIHNHLIHVPIPTVIRERKRMEPNSDLWHAVLSATGQPRW